MIFMLKYSLPSLIFVFFVTYFLSGKRRIKKILKITVEREKESVGKILSNDLKMSLILIFLLFLAAVFYYFLPSVYQTFYCPIDDLDVAFANNTGIFLIRISLVWLFVSTFWISKILDEEKTPITSLKTHKIEMAVLAGIVLLSGGIFIFISSVGTLSQFTASIILIFNSGKRFRKIT
jgi:Na+/H+ antiporter NhaD/arsenite permease-like protein